MEYKIFEGSGENNILSAKEFIEISKTNGWGKNIDYDLRKVEKALKTTFYIVTIRDLEGNLIGCARVFSDDLFFSTIPEIFVKPNFQRKGFGSILMEKIKERVGHTVIYFGAQEGKEGFYEKLGFKKGMQSYTAKFKK